jgi:NitT/TauT family transport system substrate-binding protein
LAWSEYPSWSTFGVAHTKGLINGAKGKYGPIEEKWHVDIVLREADYSTCITMYGSASCDALCVTNTDIISPAMSRPAVAILPTSTSHGADALVTVGVENIGQLRGKTVYGLKESISEYCFDRNLEELGEDERQYRFTNKDPAAAALAMQSNQKGFDAIMVWNPFVMETLKARSDAKVLFDSSKIPGEILDMVVMSRDSLEQPGGEEFACAIADTFYRVSALLDDPATRRSTLVAIGERFSSLGPDEMTQVLEKTRLYLKPADALAVFESEGLKGVMKRVTRFCLKKKIIDDEPTIAYGHSADSKAQLRFDPFYLKAVSKAL